MATKSKWFRVALEGATTDGREISRQDIVDMAATFDPATYGARVNVEHYRGIVPGGVFDMLGDVLALRAQEDEVVIGGKTQKRMGLYAEIEPLPALVELNKRGQKIYTSCEIQPDFAKTGKAGFVGLAVTDSPASLGTEVLKFSASNPAYFASRKQAPGNLFTEAHEASLEFVEVEDPADASEAGKTFSAFRKFLDTLSGKMADTGKEQVDLTNQAPKKPEEPAPAPAALASFAAEIAKFSAAMEKSVTELSSANKAMAADIATLRGQLNTTPDTRNFSRREPASGTDGRARAVY